jgi:adenylate cyclase
MAERNSSVPADRQIAYRVGINIGDIIVDGDDIYGDGVNVAARLEQLADPGGICVSRTVFNHIKNKLDVNFRDMGEQELKNIPEAVHAYQIILSQEDVGSAVIDTDEPLLLPDKPTIAVLPFDNMSGDPEQEYFADGIAEDIITSLSRYHWFFVIARNSSFAYKGRSVDVKKMSRELGVRYVLEGSVRKIGNRVRVSAQLIDGTTGNHVWAERYDRDLEDIFAVQDVITQTVVAAIEPALGRAEQERARRKPTESLHARDFYQRGMWHLHRRSKDDLIAALCLFQQAIEEEPGFAAAYAGAEEACLYQFSTGIAEAPDDIRKKMVFYGRRAVDLDNSDAFTHFAFGRALITQGEHQAAFAELKVAVDLNPSFAQAYYGLGMAQNAIGRHEEAIASFEIAMRLSPHDPYIGQFMVRMSEAYLFMRRPEEAVEWAERSLRQPNITPTRWVLLAASLAHLGKIDEAHQSVEALQRLNPSFGLAYVRELLPIANPETMDYVLDGLRNAGLQE